MTNVLPNNEQKISFNDTWLRATSIATEQNCEKDEWKANKKNGAKRRRMRSKSIHYNNRQSFVLITFVKKSKRGTAE